MNEDKIWTEINQIKKDVNNIKTDVTSVKSSMGRIESALLGDDFGNQGYAGRIEHLETVYQSVDVEVTKNKTYRTVWTWVLATMIGSGGIFSIFKFLIPLLAQK